MDLFTSTDTSDNLFTPLADILRPDEFDMVFGQDHLLGSEGLLAKYVDQGKIPSMLLWGPPGSGKTTIARAIARQSKYYFTEFSAVMSGVADIKKVVSEAATRRSMYQKGTIVFIDEIHRFNKSQQDAFLPHVESGVFTLIGATTENPSFSINAALLSRCKVFILNQLDEQSLSQVIDRAVKYYDSIGTKVSFDDEARKYLIGYADGDARRLLTTLESVVAFLTDSSQPEVLITPANLQKSLQSKTLAYDRNGEAHYTVISALHKSMRDSDPDGSVYWLSRMLEAGEDPMYIARRLVRAAAEDIGLADPQALVLAQSALNGCEKIGMPECSVLLAETVIYLALAPKSNAVYTAYARAREATQTTANEPVPMHLRNASTSFMKQVGYGEGYVYAHDQENAEVDQQHLPDSLNGQKFYYPTDRGWEGSKKKHDTHK